MRRRFPIWSLAALLAAAMVLGPRYARGEAGSFPGFVFHLTPYGESREQEAFYQGLVIGPRGEAVVPICAIERATHAIGLFAQGQSATIGEVQAVDEAAGLATVRLEGPKPARSRGPFSPFPPERGHRVQFLNTSRDGTWAVVQCSLRSVEVVRDLPGLAVVRTTLPLPPPGGVVLDADGRLLGSIAVRFGEGDVGVVVSADRIEALKAEPPLNQTLALWSAGREDRWSDSTFAGYLEGVYACSEGRYGEAMRLLEEHVGAAG
ncbi:MAG: hypothetical protein JSV00_01230 [bacterium]|nr:MAG: hypothetical protein JSV00_01230 [bacterium]